MSDSKPTEKQKYCDEHTARLRDSGVDLFYFDNTVIKHIVFKDPAKLANTTACYACLLGEDLVVSFLKEAADIEAKVTAGGGTYTTDKLAIFRGGTEEE